MNGLHYFNTLVANALMEASASPDREQFARIEDDICKIFGITMDDTVTLTGNAAVEEEEAEAEEGGEAVQADNNANGNLFIHGDVADVWKRVPISTARVKLDDSNLGKPHFTLEEAYKFIDNAFPLLIPDDTILTPSIDYHTIPLLVEIEKLHQEIKSHENEIASGENTSLVDTLSERNASLSKTLDSIAYNATGLSEACKDEQSDGSYKYVIARNLAWEVRDHASEYKTLIEENTEILNRKPTTTTLAEYIRVVATGYLIYPSSSGGMGIGNSQEARVRIDKINASKQKPRPANPDRPDEDWLFPPERPNDLPKYGISDIRSTNSMPDELKNYIAYLSKNFLRGILRICFAECGMKSYIIHRNIVIREALADSLLKHRKARTKEKALQIIEAANPPRWNYSKMFTLAHQVLPALVMKSMIAPMTQTVNCNKSTIAQSKDYLGENNLELIQDMVYPIDAPLDSNLQVSGSEPLSYRGLLRSTGERNYSIQDIEDSSSKDESGNEYKFVPESDGELPEQPQLPAEGLSYNEPDNTIGRRLKKKKLTKFASAKINGPTGTWNIVRLDKDDGDEDSTIKYGCIAFDGDGTNDEHLLYFRGGKTYKPDVQAYECHDGVSLWCWTWHGYFDQYRHYGDGDIGYMLISDKALSSRVLDQKPETYYDADRTTGSLYDSSAFGVVTAGNETDRSYNIPGLIKYECFQGRNDRTLNSKKPGGEDEVTYSSELVPNGGNIKGIIPLENLYGVKKNHAMCINNSIFVLSLIGKWDPSIKIRDIGDDYDASSLVELMSKWFPNASGGNAVTVKDNTMPRLKIRDISDAAEIIEHMMSQAEDLPKKYVFDINGKQMLPVIALNEASNISNSGLVVMVDVNAWLKLDDKDLTIHPNEEQAALMSFGFIKEDGKLRPINAKPVPYGTLIKMIPKTKKRSASPNDEIGYDPVEGMPDEGIYWTKPFASSSKNRKVGITERGDVYISGPETEGEPQLFCNGSMSIPRIIYRDTRGTYIPKDNGEFNLWFATNHGGTQTMNIAFSADKVFETVGNPFPGTTNILLRRRDGAQFRYALGNIKGNPAMLNRMNADRYFAFIDISDAGIVDMLGLDYDTLETIYDMGPNFIGLAVANGNTGENHVGTIDWYTKDSLEYSSSLNVTMDMLDHGKPSLPKRYIP